ncbi:SusC/RagA family TonB-linked outer membrane protein [Flavobacterium branchiophilum]|uniref:TonB-dependent receptor plug domain-containing protein n=1 Tax=Flavobacterium branchiophilum TaxID=55197 RepID=A0A2H3KLI3_9FLAO|nr:SusC/RagA family TonB-linked outer membrane protein [Flavobacterium branchiophilum]PDS26523.1 hypothetical protein B0A77_02170 [Flavobacterium branchiophilum]
MRSKFKWIYTLLLALAMQFSFAQEKTVTGVVSDATGALPGANVTLKSTKKGVQTDLDGKFSIKASQGDALIISYAGFETKTVQIGAASNYNVKLQENAKVLEDVVVVGQSQSKDKKKLTYQVSSLSSKEIEGKPQADVIRSLQGKVSGVQITNTGGMAGSTSNFVFRGVKSFTGSSQPLFIIDGVPFDTSKSDITGSFNQGGASSSNRFLDLDPSNIENISFLKGLAASVTYGSAGRNGVVLITTKGGKKKQKMKVDYMSSVYFSEVANLPEYTNKYGGGSDLTIGTGTIGNWGAAFDSSVLASHVYDQPHLNASFPEYIGVKTPWVAAPNNVKDFFRKGLGTQHSLSLSGGTENVVYNFNGSYTDEDGIVANNNVTKYNFGGKFGFDISDKFKINSSFTFFNTQYTTPPVSAANGAGAISVFSRLIYLPRNYDLMNLPYQNPVTGASVYYRNDLENPRWLLNNSKLTQNVDRFFGVIEPKYALSSKIDVKYRLGFDRYTDSQDFYVNRGAVTTPYNLGYLRSIAGINTIIDQNLIFTHKTIKISEDFTLDPLLGVSARRDSYTQKGISSQGQIQFGATDHSYFSSQVNNDVFAGDLDIPLQWTNLLGAYATLDFSYKNYLTFNLSGRNDWGSMIETNTRSLFYPSASFAFLPSNLFTELKDLHIDFLKLRGAYATSAGFPQLYRSRNFNEFNSNIYTNTSSIPGVSSQRRLGNPNLKPELHKEFEVGAELEMFKRRVKLDVSMYFRQSKNQIVSRALDPGTGYTSITDNAGRIDNKGIEANLTVIPFKTDDFEWDVTGIFYRNVSKVVELPAGQERITISGFSNGISNAAIVGEPYGVLFGSYALTDANGNFLINPGDGTIISSTDVGLPNKVIGDPNPDYTLSVNNTFNYKGFNLSILMEFTKGGDFYSNTIENLLRRGVTRDTENGREQSHIIPGYYANPNNGAILLDANNNQIPNNIQISANNVYFLNTLDAESQNVYDATRLRLRELSFGYVFPAKYFKNTGLSGLSINFVGSNLWLKAFNIPKYTNVDPDLISTGQGNGLGLDFQTAPQSRRFGMNIKINF